MGPWYRSWPDRIPAGRAHIIDGLSRLVMRDQNYATVPEFQPWPRHAPGWFMLEWDIALGSAERERFAAHALEQPDRVRVAPYLLYPSDRQPVQCHRTKGTPIPDGFPTADTFGLGCVYFPQAVLDDLWAGNPPHRLERHGVLDDVVLSEWYRSRYGPAVVDWTVHPQHLHGD